MEHRERLSVGTNPPLGDTMPHFYFHLQYRGMLAKDPEGTELPDLDAARAYALASARELLAEAIKGGREFDGETFIIADDRGRGLDSVAFMQALPKHMRGKE